LLLTVCAFDRYLIDISVKYIGLRDFRPRHCVQGVEEVSKGCGNALQCIALLYKLLQCSLSLAAALDPEVA
jgi:hypothetical protein